MECDARFLQAQVIAKKISLLRASYISLYDQCVVNFPNENVSGS
jgi:hypothetical protein